MTVAWHRQWNALKIVRGKREYVFFVVNQTERDAIVVGQCLSKCNPADETEHRKGEMSVEPGDGPDFAHGTFTVFGSPEDFECMSL